MESKPGFKECPKCGLRNKPTAMQCDFCGQNLTSSDDWESHIKDLESLTRMGERKSMDDRTSRRIESTIIRKDMPTIKLVEVRETASSDEQFERSNEPEPIPELKVEEVLAPVVIKAPEPQEVVEEPIIEPVKELPVVVEEVAKVEVPIPSVEPKMPEPAPVVEMAAPETPVVVETEKAKTAVVTIEERPIPAKQKIAAQPGTVPKRRPALQTVKDKAKPKKATVPAKPLPKIPVEVRLQKLRFKISTQNAMVVLAVGIILYLVALALSAFGSLNEIGGLSIGAVSSVLIIFGAVVIYPSLRRKGTNEVFICPKCHESVEKNKKNCPACGAMFSPED